MNIDKIGGSANIQQAGQAKQVKNATSADLSFGSDSVSISKEAMRAQEVAQVQKIVAQTPDVRADRVKEVRERIVRGDYDNLSGEILDQIAGKISQSLLREKTQ